MRLLPAPASVLERAVTLAAATAHSQVRGVHEGQLAACVVDVGTDAASRLELDRRVRPTTLAGVEAAHRAIHMQLHVVGHDIAEG